MTRMRGLRHHVFGNFIYDFFIGINDPNEGIETFHIFANSSVFTEDIGINDPNEGIETILFDSSCRSFGE